MELPSELEPCIEKFWSDNPELKRHILKDWYAGGYVSTASNCAGLKAVSEWLNAAPLSNGDRA
jgi:hypothetical protein